MSLRLWLICAGTASWTFFFFFGWWWGLLVLLSDQLTTFWVLHIKCFTSGFRYLGKNITWSLPKKKKKKTIVQKKLFKGQQCPLEEASLKRITNHSWVFIHLVDVKLRRNGPFVSLYPVSRYHQCLRTKTCHDIWVYLATEL